MFRSKNSNSLWNLEQEELLRRLAEEGISITRAAAQQKRTVGAVRAKAQRLNIQFKPQKRLRDIINENSKAT